MELEHKLKRCKIVFHPNTVKILLILKKFREGLCFTELMLSLRMNPSVLSRYIRHLMEIGAVKKYDGRYVVTEKGVELFSRIEKVFEVLDE
ncbi:winged helix-turn-helix domain-containing protein [Archaeoglobus profundus]|uniref:Transcriptional regulator, ArsR family n=1 Tax=Archaeoglobus profundus (strain DSM 5631 / JCM 9629 / NBRC 100127 / Av18) TaxID=572546 RepID=D2RE73_ARCPA|nr:winged helix-turn-helix domain-containing protein [Archaeoglobus profundus]ADB58417.1 transcriptional regulator, ArsR family [Archaeoglobus profundus DSM 5631]